MTARRDRESPEAGTGDAQIARIAPSTCGNLVEHDVFLLGGLVDRWTVFGVPLSHRNTLTRCEVVLAVDAPDRPNVGTIGEMLCFVERRFAEDGISFYSDATKATELLRVEEHSPERALKKIASFFGYPDTTYHVTDADGTRIGGIRKLFGERTYPVSDASARTS